MHKVAPRNKKETVPGLLVISYMGNIHMGIGDSDSNEEHREAKLREKWWGVSVCVARSPPVKL